MKKVIFLFAMIFAVTFVMAQNTAETIQTGDGNGATVEQIGTFNDVTVTQIGNLNVGNSIQDGNNNLSEVSQLQGNSNIGSVNQNGDNNEGVVLQGYVAGYYDRGYPDYDIAASNNIGSVNQNGQRNYGKVSQMGDYNQGALTQEGDYNVGYIYAGWGVTLWGGPLVKGDLNIATMDQIGDENWGGIWSYGSENDAFIEQKGNRNKGSISQGYIYQNTIDAKYPVTLNFADIAQIGNNNNARLFQLGDDNSFTLTQNGDNNDVGGERSVDPREEYFQQKGDGNMFLGVQNYGATLDHASHQFGDCNEIDMTQGEDDWAKITQDGNLNDVMLLQKGGGQIATITQMGNSNSSSVTQEP